MEHMSYAKAISWIDDCRIPTDDKLRKLDGTFTFNSGNGADMKGKKNAFVEAGLGRFPANILVSDDMLNDGVIIKGGTGKKYEPQYKDTSEIYGKYDKLQVSSFNDKGTNSRYYDIDKWFNNLLESCG